MTELEALRTGGKALLARLLARIETEPEAPGVTGLLDAAHATPKGVTLGLTGPPGVGKSTLIDGLIREGRRRGQRVAVIAVDPSSQRSGGALLGDRTRFTIDPDDDDVFIRSMAARDRLGGVAEITYPVSVIMRALFDLVIIETVGVGQSETQVADMADLVAFCAQPGSGDALQFMKSGVMEIPDLVLVTKGDLADLADRTLADLRGALTLASGDRPAPDLMRCAAARGEGIAEILDWIEAKRDTLTATTRARHRQQAEAWAARHLSHRFGLEGLESLRRRDLLQSSSSIFIHTAEIATRLRKHLGTDF